jgi:hypothetical protein
VKAYVRRFETPTALSDERAQPKKDISMLKHIVSFIYNPEVKRRGDLLKRNPPLLEGGS